MDNMIRVLHIFSGFGGGISSLVKNLVQNKDDDFIFDTMAFSYAKGESFVSLIEKQGGNAYLIPRIRRDGLVSLIKNVNIIIKSGHYDVVHCHLSSFTALIFLIICRINGIRNIIVHAHSTIQDSWWDRLPCFYSIGQWINYHFSSVFFTCSDLAAIYVFGNKYLRLRESILIPNGIDETLFREILTDSEKDRYRYEFGIDKDAIVLLHMGRFNVQKNHKFLIRIISRLVDKNRDVILLLAGEGELQEEIKCSVVMQGLTKWVRFLNRRDDVSKLMQFADCVLLPSLNEGLPTVAIESQASGTLVLLSDKITRQCDMGIGLVSFLPLNDLNAWVDNILNDTKKNNIEDCLNRIRENGFTSREAGKNYCNFLRNIKIERQ